MLAKKEADLYQAHLEEVLNRLQQSHVKLHESQCKFMVPSVIYLGFRVLRECTEIHTKATEAV